MSKDGHIGIVSSTNKPISKISQPVNKKENQSQPIEKNIPEAPVEPVKEIPKPAPVKIQPKVYGVKEDNKEEMLEKQEIQEVNPGKKKL